MQLQIKDDSNSQFRRLKPQRQLRSRPSPTHFQPAKAGFVDVAANLFAQFIQNENCCKDEVTIKASASKVWRVLAHEFADIGQWASVIPESTAVTHSPTLAEAPVAGRICANSVPGFNHIQEEFTYYDEANMRFGYIATDGMPAFVKRAENNWSVKPLATNQCLVEIRGEITLPPVLGLFLAPLMKLQFGRLGAKTVEELQYYVEHNKPHPRKVKAHQKRQGMLAKS